MGNHVYPSSDAKIIRYHYEFSVFRTWDSDFILFFIVLSSYTCTRNEGIVCVFICIFEYMCVFVKQTINACLFFTVSFSQWLAASLYFTDYWRGAWKRLWSKNDFQMLMWVIWLKSWVGGLEWVLNPYMSHAAMTFSEYHCNSSEILEL